MSSSTDKVQKSIRLRLLNEVKQEGSDPTYSSLKSYVSSDTPPTEGDGLWIALTTQAKDAKAEYPSELTEKNAKLKAKLKAIAKDVSYTPEDSEKQTVNTDNCTDSKWKSDGTWDSSSAGVSCGVANSTHWISIEYAD